MKRRCWWYSCMVLMHEPMCIYIRKLAGPEDLGPQHLKDSISISADNACTFLLTNLTKLVDRLTNGHLPTAFRRFLYGVQLHGFCKSSGDRRPIAVGCTYWRLAANACLKPYVRVSPTLPGWGRTLPGAVKLQSMPQALSWCKCKVKNFC